MNESDDRELDALLEGGLRMHLASVLEPHTGRAGDMFLARVQAAERGISADVTAGPYRMWWVVAGGIAACLAAAWLIQALGTSEPVTPGRSPLAQHGDTGSPRAGELREVLRSVSWRTVDEGTVVLNDVPLRRVRRQVVETERWYDVEHQMHVEVTTPRQEVIFVGMRQQ
jgi:hypothetical protein